jgi:transposase
MVRDPQTGKYRRTRLFVMTLGHSRKAVRLLVFRSSTQTWAELHETAFRRLGGAFRLWRALHKRNYVKDRIMRRNGG